MKTAAAYVRVSTERQDEYSLERMTSMKTTPTCLHCGSAAITSSRKGYKPGCGLFWGLALGLVLGNIGSNTV